MAEVIASLTYLTNQTSESSEGLNKISKYRDFSTWPFVYPVVCFWTCKEADFPQFLVMPREWVWGRNREVLFGKLGEGLMYVYNI